MSFLKRFSGLFTGNLMGQGMAFITQLLLSYKLSLDDFGNLSFYLALLPSLILIFDLGINTVVITKYNAGVDYRRIAYVVKSTTSILLIALVYTFSDNDIFLLLSIGAALGCINSLNIAVVNVVGTIKMFLLLNNFVHVIRLIFTSWYLFFSNLGFDIDYFLSFYIYSLIFPVLLALVSFRWGQEGQIEKSSCKGGDVGKFFSTSFQVFLSTLSIAVLMRVEFLVLEYYSDAKQLALFALSFQLCMVISLASASIQVLVQKDLNSYFNSTFLYKILKYTFLFFVFSVALSPILSEGLEFTFSLIYKDKFSGIGTVIIILAIAYVVGAANNVLTPIAHFNNQTKLVTFSSFIQLAIGVFMGGYLVLNMGAVGAALTSLLIRVFSFCFLFYVLIVSLKRKVN